MVYIYHCLDYIKMATLTATYWGLIADVGNPKTPPPSLWVNLLFYCLGPKGCVALLFPLLCHNFANYCEAILIRNSVNWQPELRKWNRNYLLDTTWRYPKRIRFEIESCFALAAIDVYDSLRYHSKGARLCLFLFEASRQP